MAASLKSVLIQPKAAHTGTVIWLHGLGDSGAGWSFMAEHLATQFPNIKWVLPNAPNIPITLNGGYRMPGWFDLTGLTFSEKMVEDEKGMLSTVSTVNQLIRSEVDSGTPSNRIVLGGFSQGSAMSLLTGLTSEYKFAGIIGLSGWLPLHSKISAMASDANKKTPIFMGHGDIDPVVQFAYGSQSAAALKAKGYNVDFHSYPGVVHTASDEEIADVANFLKKVLPSV
ncbi:hypothetical protein K450DRAFT_239591 [Umbelopsis ramanniana AG]|uniref:Acyl-protein thioesterase 1 n=1 Tax=Umbelopsis ramanniana AG TaxID=1314678 RepID=A0AAD5EAM8_UMBRA|nr:uncharacterized protein K450DRAFT_239591 [Umbelopsis ramanniana AG]KAI8579892.1 hypothetical protein K450DRAFT_239591 [Umbelopsis ramanniana AG]